MHLIPPSLSRLARRLYNGDTHHDDPFDWSWEERRESYDRWQKLHAGSLYHQQGDGGYREIILKELGKSADCDLPLRPYFNPLPTIVDAHANMVGGSWGRGIKPVATDEGESLTPGLQEAAGRVWSMSRLDVEQAKFAAWSALYGCAGLRIVARDSADPSDRRVRVKLDPPHTILDYDADGQGNLRSVLLEYAREEGPLGERETHTIREELTRHTFRAWRDGEPWDLVNDTRAARGFVIPNPLGLCPYVLLKHSDHGGDFGQPAHAPSANIVDAINALIARVERHVDKGVFVQWFGTGPGSPPKSLKLGDERLVYATQAAGEPAPDLRPMVPPLPLGDLMAVPLNLIELHKARQPEMALADVRSLSGQSGETIAQLLKPLEHRLQAARRNADASLVRAMQIALSYGQLIGMWDFGGGGSQTSVDANYRRGVLDFAFDSRPLLAPTVSEVAAGASARHAEARERYAAVRAGENVVPLRTRLIEAGYSQEEATRFAAEQRAADTLPVDNL